MLISDLYLRVSRRLLEPGGFQLGLLSEFQFLQYYEDVLFDFLKSTGVAKIIETQSIASGTSLYTVSDREVTIDDLLVTGRFVAQTTLDTLDDTVFMWRTKTGPTKKWHQDGLAAKNVEIVPTPNWNGAAYAPKFIDQTSVGTLLSPIKIPAADRNLTTYGTQIPLPAATLLGIACNNPPTGTVSIPYAHKFPAFGGVQPYTFAIATGSLPPGLTLDTATGIVSGTPTTLGTYAFTVQVAGG